jgi:signal transduction protein with GAF and PtsI domain
MTGYAVLHNQPVFAAEARKNPHFKIVEEADESEFQSLLAVPLVIDDAPIGALNVQTADRHDYSADEVEVLSLIGDLAATTLMRAQLYYRQQRQINELRTLAQVSETVTSPLYLDEMLGIVSEMAAQVMDASVCHIYLLDEASSTLQRHTGSGVQTESMPHFALDQGIMGQVANGGVPVYVSDLAHEAAFEEQQWAVEAGLVSLLSVPLSVRDRVIGVLNCYTTKQHEFSDKERTLLLTLANQTALAIDIAQQLHRRNSVISAVRQSRRTVARESFAEAPPREIFFGSN